MSAEAVTNLLCEHGEENRGEVKGESSVRDDTSLSGGAWSAREAPSGNNCVNQSINLGDIGPRVAERAPSRSFQQAYACFCRRI
jgi:hypothetical protein